MNKIKKTHIIFMDHGICFVGKIFICFVRFTNGMSFSRYSTILIRYQWITGKNSKEIFLKKCIASILREKKKWILQKYHRTSQKLTNIKVPSFSLFKQIVFDIIIFLHSYFMIRILKNEREKKANTNETSSAQVKTWRSIPH